MSSAGRKSHRRARKIPGQTVRRNEPRDYVPNVFPLFDFEDLVSDHNDGRLVIKRIFLRQDTGTTWIQAQYTWHLQVEAIKTCPLFRKYNVNDFLLVNFSKSLEPAAIRYILNRGFRVSSGSLASVYKFFGHSASLLRGRGCLLYNSRLARSASVLYSPFGNFDIRPTSKKMARIGLLLSDADVVATLTDSDISIVEDVVRNGYNFTDGCGCISLNTARKVMENLPTHYRWLYERQKYVVPSVFQIRLQGCKGVLALDLSLSRGIRIRPSMRKFEWRLPSPHVLALVGFSRPVECGKLNRQFIQLLSCLGVPDRVFLQKQKNHFRNVQRLLGDSNVAIAYLSAFGHYELAAKLMQNDNHDDARRQLRDLQSSLKRGKSAQRGKSRSEKLQIPIEDSRFVYGIADPSETLQYGQCFFQPTIRGDPQVFVDVSVVVGRSPAHHVGDIRRLTCVDIPACRHLVDCIVFPVNGDRPHADEMAGGDLDGDKFFVCWDEDLDLPSFRLVKPFDYRLPPTDFNQSDDPVDGFACYDTTMLSTIDRLFNKWADARGIRSVECQELARLFSVAVDAAKTGMCVTISHHLTSVPTPKEGFRPVWLTMEEMGRLFVQDNALSNLRSNQPISDDVLADVVKNLEVNFSDYQLFRLVWKWWNKCEKPASSFENVATHINFSRMSLVERRLALLDVTPDKALQPVLPMSQIFNALYHSNIFRPSDLTALGLDRCGLGWRSMPSLSASTLNPSILTALMRLKQAKLFVFEFVVDSVSLVLAVLFCGSFPFSDDEKVVCLSQLTTCDVVSCMAVRGGGSGKVRLDRDYSIFWDGTTLQLYKGSKGNTFIFMKFTAEGPKFSVALDRYNARMKERETRIQKEAYRRLEVYIWTSPEDNLPAIFRPPTMKRAHGRNDQEIDDSTDDDLLLREALKDSNHFEEQCLIEITRLEEELQEKRRISSLGSLWRRLREARTRAQKAFVAPFIESFLFRGSAALQSVIDYLDVLLGLLSTPSSFALNLSDFSVDEDNLVTSSRVHRLLSSMIENKLRFGSSELRRLFDEAPFSSNVQEADALLKSLRDGKVTFNDQCLWGPAFNYYRTWTTRLCTEMLQRVAAARCGTIVTVKVRRGTDPDTVLVSFLHGSLELKAGDAMMIRDCKENLDYVLQVVRPNAIGHVTARLLSPGGQDLIDDLIARRTIWDAFCLADFVQYFSTRKALEKVCLVRPDADSSLTLVVSSMISPLTLNECDSSNDAKPKMLGSSESVTIIDGPPGTGKTQVAVEIACGWLRTYGDAVLVVAPNRCGINVLIERAKLKIRASDIVDLDCNDMSRGGDDYDRRIVFTCQPDVRAYMTFNYIVVDDAHLLPECIMVSALAGGCKKLALIGDLRQNEYGKNHFYSTLYHRLADVGLCVHHLRTQFRMHRGIAEYPLKTFYDLFTGDEVPRVHPTGFPWPSSSYPVAFVNVDGRERDQKGSKLNREELEEVYRIFQEILQSGDVASNGVCVITPYVAQAECVRRPVEAKTVDDVFGREFDVVIFSAVRCNDHGSTGVLNDCSLFRLVLTRAKRGLIVVGSEKTLNKFLLGKMSRFVLHKIAGVTVKYKAECNVKEKREGYLMVMMMNIIIDDQVFFSSSIRLTCTPLHFILLLQTQDRMMWVFRAGVFRVLPRIFLVWEEGMEG